MRGRNVHGEKTPAFAVMSKGAPFSVRNDGNHAPKADHMYHLQYHEKRLVSLDKGTNAVPLQVQKTEITTTLTAHSGAASIARDNTIRPRKTAKSCAI